MLIGAAALRAPGAVLAGIVTVAFLLDAYDGVIARRSGAASRALRASTIVNIAFYACATAALIMRTGIDSEYAIVTGRSGPLLDATLILGMLSEVEGLGASLVLSAWRRDVPTLWHAIRIERGNQRAA